MVLRFVIGITLFSALWAQLPRILDSHVVEEDFRNLFWVNLHGDSELYQNDLWVENQIKPLQIIAYSSSSPLYGFLYQLATPFFSPILFSKLLIFLLLLIAIIYFYMILYIPFEIMFILGLLTGL